MAKNEKSKSGKDILFDKKKLSVETRECKYFVPTQ